MKIEDAAILVVDDEPYLRECYARWLRRGGCRRVLTAADGVEALAMVEAEAFHVLVTDVHMPQMDGVELIRSIRRLGKSIPSVIFVSGYQEVDRVEMFDLGVESMLAKPFLAETLVREVATSLAERRELWLTPMPETPVQEVWIEDATLGPQTGAGRICFGRGGFTASLAAPAAEGPVSFVVTLGPDPRELRGQGYLRWYLPETGLGAIQFAYLAADSRERLLELVTADARGSFLPVC